ncbi:hypothetical protein P153DRAFT_371768 [Dothidotthia symphoricarpi CBS 119687]|uniref:Uncharacterized protein n=1 Tax=Dothidotthia symphoricarpi CBS 119687 TaxID=1392245 RepID=A0A6A6ATU1_9PLEO|nr:uncharacterized protein P153DRAFT_371768 [Dothidotthia symphoricarpi CBS 119687]KAF2134375.1 hypothetical protein P153DRAFT_371768 [Dothidotthia symphoricarpi CBS 119687]
MAPMTRPALSRNESMQKYMLLSAQKEALQRRMSLQIPSNEPMTSSSPEFQSLSSSPTDSLKFTTPFPASEPVPMRIGMSSRHSIDDIHTEESHKLFEINQQIVATLTELLNTQSVRSDDKHRAWIQERLMEAEHQSRRQRRRHGSNSERDFASSIAQHLELNLHTAKTWA